MSAISSLRLCFPSLVRFSSQPSRTLLVKVGRPALPIISIRERVPCVIPRGSSESSSLHSSSANQPAAVGQGSTGGTEVKVEQNPPQEPGTVTQPSQVSRQMAPVRRHRARSALTPLMSTFSDLWNPLFPGDRSLKQMLDTVDHMFEDMLPTTLGRSELLPPTGDLLFRPPWDVVETEKDFRMRVDMPGLTKEEVKVRLEDDNVLFIKGEHSSEKKDNLWASRSSKTFQTRLVLPDNVNKEGISAELKDGVLQLTVPKLEEKDLEKKHMEILVQ